MSYDTNSLKPLVKYPTTNVLQEYFIPVNLVPLYLHFFWTIINRYNVNLLNVSLRYVKKSDIPILNYAPSDCIAIVLYLNISNNLASLKYAEKWTRTLIDKAIKFGGSYYLPYLPFASLTQFQKAYPNYGRLLEIKRIYDPKSFIDKSIC